ncbi:hypothetical protein BS50DRAFT_287 [Corynespora cassiicola Philippines]|uniref:Zn(2)-C6 fungal-type domain-containing protein n=1 Tax=Corynespora cassiicola Philippines TaxID=1448308 RepID=A0A2T2P837_CORCC|nr:hypothetical protein BS50DRAFT_287 [Corynespora cassiicola Philippines]
MSQPEQGSRESATSSNHTTFSRRNLPRASHACQRCRAKKAKCNQRRPCSNCIKHSVECEYGIRRRNARNSSISARSQPREHLNRQERVRSPVSGQRYQDEPIRCESSGRTQGASHSGFTPHTWLGNDSDVVGDVNQHTHGTEFYGTSSNFVLLNQLFAYAQQNLPGGQAGSSGSQEMSHLSPSSFVGSVQPTPAHDTNPTPGRISIINLLSNEEALSPPSRSKTPLHGTERQYDGDALATASDPPREEIDSNTTHRSHTIVAPHIDEIERHQIETPGPVGLLWEAETRLEREYVRIYLNNLHHLHPMIDTIEFTTRCESHIWKTHASPNQKKSFRHFLSLYNMVVAIGALIAGSDISQVFGKDIRTCTENLVKSGNLEKHVSSRALSRVYFRRARELLGDIFEVCSLESAQTLFLMSLYCQNSHKPHACYMYCGQAVRTALAIGLPNESMSSSVQTRKAARRTWWCIYSHEIDMSCSSGRRDSLGKPRNYQLPFPVVPEGNSNLHHLPETESKSSAMINEMVHYAAILRRVSKQLYHDSKGLTLLQKSIIAKEFDSLLDDWKGRLPEYLNFCRVSFREEEWAAKQKLVLHLRYLNARILIHRPFLSASSSRRQLQASTHVELCLDAARETIRILYDAYAHRHYFRTWWYNATYTLYAGMVVLYVIMLGHTTVSSDELLNDVIKAQEVLQSMDEAIVARRSADLIREGLEVARACAQYRKNTFISTEGDCTAQGDDEGPHNHFSSTNITPIPEDHIPRTLFSYTGHGPDPGTLLSSLIDPNLLQDFAAGANMMPGIDMQPFTLDSFLGDGLDDSLMQIP